MGIVAAWLRVDLRRRWRSLLVLTLLIAISAGVVLTAIAGARRGSTALDRLVGQTDPATVAVLANQPGFDWAPVRALPEVEALATFPVATVDIEGIPAENFPSDDPAMGTSVERPVVLAGRLADPSRADEAVVTAAFVDAYGKGVGDTVNVRLFTPESADLTQVGDPLAVQPDGPQIPTKIVGVVCSVWFSDTVGIPGRLIPSVGLFQRYPANVLGAKQSVFVNALVRLRGGAADLPAFRTDLARVSGRSDIELLDLVAEAAKAQRVNEFESACLLAFGAAALLAAVVLVGQAVARYTAASVDELQLLRPIGMTPRQVVLAATAGPAVVGVLGTGVGVAAAVAASRWMPLGAPALLEPHPGVDADWLVLGPGWVALAAAVVGGAAAAAWLAIAAARAGSCPRRSVAARWAAGTGLPLPVVVGTRFALEPGRGRSSVPVRPALFGAVIGVLGVLAAFTFSTGVTDAAEHPERFGQTYQLDTFLGANGEDFTSSGPALAAVPADPDVAGVNDARSSVASASDTSITMYTQDPVGTVVPAVLDAGRPPSSPGEVALAPTSARAIGADVGSVIELTGSKEARQVTVTGIGFVPVGSHNSYDDGGWLTPGGYDQLFDGFKLHVGQVVVRPGVDPATLIPRLTRETAAASGADPIPFRPVEPVPAVAQIRDVQVLPVVLGGFLALLAVIGLAFGIPLGFALGRALWRAVADSTPLHYVPPVALLALALVAPLALLVVNLLAAPPARRATRLRISQVLRAE